MIYALWQMFHSDSTALNVLRYITFRGAAAAITGFLIVALLGDRFVVWLRSIQFQQNVRDDGPESHKKKQGTPTMGGLLIFGAFAVSAILYGNFSNRFVWLLMLGTLAFSAVGFVDDLLCVVRKNHKGLSGRLRLAIEFVITTAVIGVLLFTPEWTDEVWVPLFKNIHPQIGYLYIVFGYFVVAGMANFVNLTDGLDGLATGVSLPVLAALGLIAYASGHVEFARYLGIFYSSEVGELLVLVGALMGALAGFLWHNAHPATMFMGDVGSLGIGGFIGLLAICIKQELLLPIVGAVFFAEGLSVMLQVGSYKLRKKRIFRMAPIHHHFELMGWAENKVIVRFWIVGFLAALLGVALLKVR